MGHSSKTAEVIYTLRAMGDEAFIMKREEAGKAEKRFSIWYRATITDVLNGAKLPEPELKIEHKPKPRNIEKGKTEIQRIKALFD